MKTSSIKKSGHLPYIVVVGNAFSNSADLFGLGRRLLSDGDCANGLAPQRKGPCSLESRGLVSMGWEAGSAYSASANLIWKVLDFIKSGGPELTVGRTIFELWMGL